MTDIKQIVSDCANRIFDRMELCRGSAMLKSDIEREVEIALRESMLPECHTLVDTEHDEHLGKVRFVTSADNPLADYFEFLGAEKIDWASVGKPLPDPDTVEAMSKSDDGAYLIADPSYPWSASEVPAVTEAKRTTEHDEHLGQPMVVGVGGESPGLIPCFGDREEMSTATEVRERLKDRQEKI